ncbi:hypothetical protein MtrunA17_Chr8g0346121 [Medicago truncatula]|uniref:Uncharacterized protein n=1 Tax=Medicago truncatula TaxID=3880 RepID=A0A396GE37_MEDTR|nr:hypothetical protein MtrunA17_Chr8g0346121 [Medicago truncatula]
MLWNRILAARYGEVGGRICVGGRLGSVWWKNLTAISDGVGLGVENWFFDNLNRCVSDDSSTLFW